MNNIYEINDYQNIDYEINNAMLMKKQEIDTLIINNSDVNLDILNYLIKDTNVKKIVFNNCKLEYEEQTLINIADLVLNNVYSNDYELFIKFSKLQKLTINNITDIFDCYYLRKLVSLKELQLNNLNLRHLGGLGYLNELETLYLLNIPINNWTFITKVNKLKTLYLNSNIPNLIIPNLSIRYIEG